MRTLIPVPKTKSIRRWRAEVPKALGLTQSPEDQAKYRTIYTHLYRLADIHLRAQDLPHFTRLGYQWQDFVEEVCKKYPIFLNFKLQWPIYAMVKMRQVRKRERDRVCQKKRERAIQNSRHERNTSIREAAARYSQALLNHTENRTRSPSISDSEESVQELVARPASPAPSVRRKRVTRQSSSAAAPSTTLFDASLDEDPEVSGAVTHVDSDYVLCFLASLTPSLDRLLKPFIAIGVKDAECLGSILALPEKHIEALLKVLSDSPGGALSSLEWEILRDGLAKYAEVYELLDE